MNISKITLRKQKLSHVIYMLSICIYTVFRMLSSTYFETLLFLPIEVWNSFVNYFCIINLLLLFFIQKKMSIYKLLVSALITFIVGLISLKVFDRPLFISYLFIIAFPKDISLKKIAKGIFYCYLL